MSAPQRPGDEERDRLAEAFVDQHPGAGDYYFNSHDNKISYLAGYDKAMERAQENAREAREEIDRQRAMRVVANGRCIALEAEVKRLVEVLEWIEANGECNGSLLAAQEALAPRREVK